jgi:hypothetical protein
MKYLVFLLFSVVCLALVLVLLTFSEQREMKKHQYNAKGGPVRVRNVQNQKCLGAYKLPFIRQFTKEGDEFDLIALIPCDSPNVVKVHHADRGNKIFGFKSKFGNSIGYNFKFVFRNAIEPWSMAIQKRYSRPVAKPTNVRDDGFIWGLRMTTDPKYEGKYFLRNLFYPECVVTFDGDSYLTCRVIDDNNLDSAHDKSALLWDTI